MAMRISKCVGLAGLALVLAIVPVRAQDYPAQDIHFICAFPPGSGADILVRYFAEKVRPLAGRNVIVENKPGAGGRIATESVIRAKPDGYTIFVNAGHGVASTQYFFKQPIDVVNTIRVAATINRQPFMMLVDAKKPYKTVAELTAALMPKGDKATFATSVTFGTVMGALYKQTTGLNAVEVNYKTAADSLNDVLSGTVDFAFQDPVYSLAQQREGRLRILGISSGARMMASPDLPTMTEQGIPMDISGWWAAMVPAATPQPIVDKINQWFVQVVSSPETKTFLNKNGGDPFVSTPEEAQALFLKTNKDWEGYVRLAKIVPQG